MISDNVKNIFSFLEFLNSNVEFFNNCIPLWENVENLRRDYGSLNPTENYEHKFEREEIEEKGIEAIQNFKIKCKDVVINKINELDIADLSNPVNNHFKYLGEFSILIHSQNYDKKDVELIKKAKDDYISFFRNLKLNIDAILPYDLFRDLRDDLLIDFKPFLTEEDKLKISKFKSFDEFLEFCKPQLTGFKLNSEIQKSIDNLNSTLYTTNEQNAIDLLISTAEKLKSDRENIIRNYLKENNVQMFFNNTKKITDRELLNELSLYFQFSDLLLNARNKLETIPLLKEIENRRNVKALPIQKDRNKTLLSQTERKYIAKEYALAYIFDLYAKGEMIPINVIDGGYNAKQLKQIGLDRGFSSPDTFYRAVKTVLKFDLNKIKDLQIISKDWLNAVEKLSNNWIETQQYLKKQNLIEE